MKKHYIIILLILALGYLFSASPTVDNIVVTPQSGRVVINYDLKDVDNNNQCQIMVLVSADGGATYNIFPEALTGAVGNSVFPGNTKEIIWRPSADGMEIGTNYRVKIIARDNPIDTAEEFESFIKVAGGTFDNGTANVTLSSFYISKYEVTQAEYKAVMNTNPAISHGLGEDYPVHSVTWNNAVEYCNARSLQEGLTPCYNTSTWVCDITANGYRLPTEMEWMFAAKGGNEEVATGYNIYAGTNIETELTNYAWCIFNNGSSGTSLYGTKEVGTKLPNQLGLYDMSGNVWEWCNDWYGDYNSSPSQGDPVGPTSGSERVNRGGGWSNSPIYCQVAYRGKATSSSSYFDAGFRLARSIVVPEAQVVADPVISPAGGSFEEAKTVSITCETQGANIYYTLDGTDPNQSSTLYTGAFELAETKTVKARAYRTYWNASAIVSVAYEINIPVPAGFVLVGSGTFNNEAADVTLSWFFMGRYEVTQAEYLAVMGTNPSYFSGSDKPVEAVTWFNAVAYCNARSLQEGLTACYNTSDWSCDFSANGYRLPTEMEWMFAAKGGNETPASGYNQYSGTNVEAQLTNYAWYSSNNGSSGTSLYGTKEIGTKLPNQLGLYDMTGNVWEWCNDWDWSYSSSAQTDPVGPASGSYRVYRGGSWNNNAIGCRVSYRGSINPAYGRYYIGFRLARSSN